MLFATSASRQFNDRMASRKPFDPFSIQAPAGDAEALRGPVSVSELTRRVKRAIEDGLPGTVEVIGEISNFKRHSSGHLYFTLKDQSCELSCVMWRSAAGRMKFDPADGMEVIVVGSVEVFERAGRYQLYVRKIEPRGVGALELAFRQLCEKLEAEGLFDPRRKKPLPRYPRRIAVVTSETGAAVTDILQTIRRRYPCVEVWLRPVKVQGPGAAEEIADAVRLVNARSESLGGIDVMIVGRGGGSLEDLWAFNEEVVARAIFASVVPVISAVGHEVDVSVADLVADVRAATPTAAAELAVPLLDGLLDALAGVASRLALATRGRLSLCAARLDSMVSRPALWDPVALVHRRGQRVDEAQNRMHAGMQEKLRRLRRSIDTAQRFIQRIAPHSFVMRMARDLQREEWRMQSAIRRRIGECERRLQRVTGRIDRHAPEHRAARLGDRLRLVARQMRASLGHRINASRERVAAHAELLAALSYRSVLQRGYSITRMKKGRVVVRSPEQLRDDDLLVTESAGGAFESRVVNLDQLELFE